MVLTRHSGQIIHGTSAERIAMSTTNMLTNTLFYETDKKAWYEYTGSQWESINGSAGFDYRIYIDTNDSNKIKARDHNGRVFSSHATDATTVMNAVTEELSAGSTSPSGGTNPFNNVWTGGKYGMVFIGPGSFPCVNTSSSIILKSNITYQGCGPWATEFKLANSHANNTHATVMKSSTWDAKAFTHVGDINEQMRGDSGITLKGFRVHGNKLNNTTVTTTAPIAGTATNNTAESAIESWGHGIALYGVGNTIEDVWTQMNRSCGIIYHQGPSGSNLGDVNGATGSAIHSVVFANRQNYFSPWSVKMNRIDSSFNRGNGILCRGSMTSLDDFTCMFNGESAFDSQTSAYFSGSGGWIRNGITFLNGMNYFGQSSATRNSHAFDFRLTGIHWQMENMWIEAPDAPGDCLVLGNGNQPASTASGDTLSGIFAWSQLRNVFVDNARHSLIYGSQYAYRNEIQVFLNPFVEYSRNSTPLVWPDSQYSQGVTWLGSFGNVLDIHIRDLPGPARTSGDPTHSVLIMGGTTYAGVAAGAFINDIRLHAQACEYILKWPVAGNFSNNIEIYIQGLTDFPNMLGVLEPSTASNINYGTNNIQVNAASSSSSTPNIKGRNGGQVTFTGTTGTVAHGLFKTPDVVSVTPANSAARSLSYMVSANATNIVIEPVSSVTSGSYWWRAQVGFQ